jgi:hypothetical protein
MVVVVQKIAVLWTRASRGGEGARRRAAVPVAFELPAGGAFHSIVCDERDDFAPREVEVRATVPAIDSCVLFEPARGIVRVGYQWSRECGAPARDLEPPRWVMEVRDYGRIVHNGRFADEDGWRYQQIVFNVAVVDRMRTDMFTGAEPAKTVDLRVHLR